MVSARHTSFLTNYAGFVSFWLRVLNHVLWVNLIFLEDDKDGGIQPAIHTAVVVRRRAIVHHVSFNEISNQDSGHKHNTVSGLEWTIFVGRDGFFCKVISWKQSEKGRELLSVSTG